MVLTSVRGGDATLPSLHYHSVTLVDDEFHVAGGRGQDLSEEEHAAGSMAAILQ